MNYFKNLAVLMAVIPVFHLQNNLCGFTYNSKGYFVAKNQGFKDL